MAMAMAMRRDLNMPSRFSFSSIHVGTTLSRVYVSPVRQIGVFLTYTVVLRGCGEQSGATSRAQEMSLALAVGTVVCQRIFSTSQLGDVSTRDCLTRAREMTNMARQRDSSIDFCSIECARQRVPRSCALFL